MLKKNYSSTGKYCRVTFKLPPEIEAETAAVLGDFNDWNPEARPMKKLKKGGFSATVSLSAPAEYRFRYLLDGTRWENDADADGYEQNAFGTEDSVLKV